MVPTYSSRYSALLVTAVDSADSLVGLLALARERTTGRVVVAGAHQAEYQVWLADGIGRETFVEHALIELGRTLEVDSLSFSYLPPHVPIDWLSTGPTRWRHEMDVRPRPIIRVDDATTVSAYLQQKQRGSTKNYRNRLSRLGDLRFERVRSSADLALILSTTSLRFTT